MRSGFSDQLVVVLVEPAPSYQTVLIGLAGSLPVGCRTAATRLTGKLTVVSMRMMPTSGSRESTGVKDSTRRFFIAGVLLSWVIPAARRLRSASDQCVPAGPAPRPVIVATGVMTPEEFDTLTVAEQDQLERTTADMIRRYGEDFLRRGREWHRRDLRLFGFL